MGREGTRVPWASWSREPWGVGRCPSPQRWHVWVSLRSHPFSEHLPRILSLPRPSFLQLCAASRWAGSEPLAPAPCPRAPAEPSLWVSTTPWPCSSSSLVLSDPPGNSEAQPVLSRQRDARVPGLPKGRCPPSLAAAEGGLSRDLRGGLSAGPGPAGRV